MQGGIATITLNRWEMHNAIDVGMRAELIEVLDELERHQPVDTVALTLQRTGEAVELKVRLYRHNSVDGPALRFGTDDIPARRLRRAGLAVASAEG